MKLEYKMDFGHFLPYKIIYNSYFDYNFFWLCIQSLNHIILLSMVRQILTILFSHIETEATRNIVFTKYLNSKSNKSDIKLW